MKKYVLMGLPFLLPVLVFAQQGDLNKTRTLLGSAQGALNTVIAIAVLLAFLFFIWGIADFIRKADDSTGREEGRQRMVWGVVALAILASIWGIVYWLQGELGLTNTTNAPGIFQLFNGSGSGGASGGTSGGTSGGSSNGNFNPGEDGYGNRVP